LRFAFVHATSDGMRLYTWLASLLALMLWQPGCSHSPAKKEGDPKLHFDGENHLVNIRQLTQGGTNAEAYWSFDGSRLVFQHKGPTPGVPGPGPACDQIYQMNTEGSDLKMISSGNGRTTCPYYLPNDERVLFSSTSASDKACPPLPDMSQGYVWPVYPTYQIYTIKTDVTDPLILEPGQPRAYNAEATVCKDGSVVFTSDRDGDLELYRGKLDRQGTLEDVKRITQTLGYDGGAVFSPDCKQIAWRASRPRGATKAPPKIDATAKLMDPVDLDPAQMKAAMAENTSAPRKRKESEADEYRRLLKEHLVRPTELEIWTAQVDGTHAHQVTDMGVASFAPAFTPDGRRILFASNPRDPKGRKFDLYLIDVDGTRLERVTYSDTFESFPMFSPDGKTLAFSSNRAASEPHETHVFLADWVDLKNSETRPALNMDDPSPANRFMAMVEALSAPSMEGRAPGSAGLARAEDLVASQFNALGLKPYFADFKQPVEMLMGKDKHTVTSNNVVASFGKGCGKTAPVVIGAHLDHLGQGGPESLEPSQAGLHPGADDNASGVAAMLETARSIVSAGVKTGENGKPSKDAQAISRGCFVFAAFTGEEVGISGSSLFVAELKKKRIHPKAMLNLDMVGRMESNHLIAFGSDSAREWRTILDEKCGDARLTCDGGGDGYGPSDHMAFYIAHVPVIHFFTGPHADYHRTTDTAEKINATGGVQTARVVAAVALQAASPGQALHYVKASAKPSMGKLQGKGEARGNGAYLGTIPDYATLSSPHGPGGGGEPRGGVRLAGVRAGSPAERAGVREGDTLTAIGEKSVGTLEEFMNILIGLKPGDDVVLTVRRNGVAVSLPAKVGSRKSQ
jgi:Tol biopolymer transport system component